MSLTMTHLVVTLTLKRRAFEQRLRIFGVVSPWLGNFHGFVNAPRALVVDEGLHGRDLRPGGPAFRG